MVEPATLALLLTAAVGLAGCGGSRSSKRQERPDFLGTPVVPPSHPADFALRDQDGRLVRLSAQRGRVVVVTFLYTSCPDVCPLVADSLNSALRRLGARRHTTRVLAVSIDPAGDTRQAARRWAREHRLVPQFRYLLGTRAQLAPVWRKYHVFVQRRRGSIDHLSYELLIDRQGRGRVIYGSDVRAGAVVHDVRALER